MFTITNDIIGSGLPVSSMQMPRPFPKLNSKLLAASQSASSNNSNSEKEQSAPTSSVSLASKLLNAANNQGMNGLGALQLMSKSEIKVEPSDAKITQPNVPSLKNTGQNGSISNAVTSFHAEQKPQVTPTKQLISVASAVIQQTLMMKNQLTKAVQKLETFMSDTERQTKGIISNLQLKFKELQSIGDQDEETKQTCFEELKEYMEKSTKNVEILRTCVQGYIDSLITLNDYRMPQLDLPKEIFSKAEIIFKSQDRTIANCNKMIEKVNYQLFGIQSSERHITELMRIEIEDDEQPQLKKIKTYNKKINLIMQHQDRLICDDMIYTYNDDCAFRLIQDLEQKDVLTGCEMTDSILILGHASCARMSVWKWNGNEYVFIQKSSPYHGSGYAEFTTTKLMKDPYNSMHSTVYGVFGSNILSKVNFDGRKIKECEKTKIVGKSMILVDYKLMAEDLVIVLYTHQILAINPKNRNKRASIKLDIEQDLLIIPPCFDIQLLPILIVKANCPQQNNGEQQTKSESPNTKYEYLDIMKSGFKGNLPQNIQHLKFFGVIEKVKEDSLMLLASDSSCAQQQVVIAQVKIQ